MFLVCLTSPVRSVHSCQIHLKAQLGSYSFFPQTLYDNDGDFDDDDDFDIDDGFDDDGGRGTLTLRIIFLLHRQPGSETNFLPKVRAEICNYMCVTLE